MAIIDVQKKRNNLIASIGRAALHAQYPNDFEYYAISIELVDSDDLIIDSLVFPVMPDNIVESNVSNSNQKKTANGVVSLYDTSFVPYDITFTGSFGRKFRIFTSNGYQLFSAIKNTRQRGRLSRHGGDEYSPRAFNTEIKTGFGVTKAFEKIYNDSFKLDSNGKPVKVFLYNLSLNSQYLVEFKSINLRQDLQSNMIWNYTAAFKALAPAYSVRKNNNLAIQNLLISDNLNKGIDNVIGSAVEMRRTSNININA